MHARPTAAAIDADRLARQRQRLLERRRAILGRVVRTEHDLQVLGTSLESPADEAQEETVAQLLLLLDDLGRSEIVEVDAALARLAANAYGLCAHCRTAIPWDRLEALPEARACVPCLTRPG